MSDFSDSDSGIRAQALQVRDTLRVSLGGDPSLRGGRVGLLTALAALEKADNAPALLKLPNEVDTSQAPQHSEGLFDTTEAPTP